MNNPNPFVPKGSLLEQQSQRRSRLKITVGCVLAVSVFALVAMLIEGCKREAPTDNGSGSGTTQQPDLGANTNMTSVDTSSNPPTASWPSNGVTTAGTSNSAALPQLPPPQPQPQPLTPPVDLGAAAGAGTDYIVVPGDTFAKIAKAHGVSVKAIEAANPGVDPKKLKPKQKLTIPASTKSADATTTTTSSTGATATSGGQTYTVKSGDNLSKIAKAHGIKVAALKAANNLTTDHIKQGQKLVIPAKGEAAATNTAPTTDTTTPQPPVNNVPMPGPTTPTGAPAPATGAAH